MRNIRPCIYVIRNSLRTFHRQRLIIVLSANAVRIANHVNIEHIPYLATIFSRTLINNRLTVF